ncbi:MAG: CusA/CzcA family heavy metal efflux RND transporter [Polyangiaceae bacterium]|nr:CusA/CzcA family heavy metal efflux RND transporter [Polyangiaceae bacterium]
MLGTIIALSIRHRIVVLLATCVLAVLGAQAFQKLPIDAVPDLTNVQVQVLTSAPALGPLDVERLVTTPVERAMGGLPRLVELRSISRYGVSAITVVFEDGFDPYLARQLVGERLVHARDAIPPEYGIPELGPMTTGLGEIYQFEVKGDGVSPMELRSILDWEIAPRLRVVPGVVEINTFGGQLKTFEVAVDPQKMSAHGVTLQDLFVALQTQNRLSGGGAILRGPEGILVRGDALVQSLDDIRCVLVATHDGTPIHVSEIAEVHLAPMLRQGAATRDGRGEIVAGTAMMLMGENSRNVAADVQRAVDAINATLPSGVRIEPFYDRTALVNHTIHTVARNLLEGGALVIVVLFLMLRNARAGLLAAMMIPLCMGVAFLGMHAAGVSGNLMSLGAMDFGLVVDGAIILLENSVHHLSEEREKLGRLLTSQERDVVVERSALEVRSSKFGELIIALVYLPVLTLEGVEGKMFRPMALTVLFALLGAVVLSLTFVPALASLLLSRSTVDRPSPIVTFAQRIYEPLLRGSLRHPLQSAALTFAAFATSMFLASRMGSEFVPRLDEGSIVIEINRLPSTSLEESLRQSGVIETTLRAFPEVATVITKTGRPEIANDPAGVEASDVWVMLKPREEWPPPRDRDELVDRMSKALRSEVPGTVFGFSQPIEMRMNELVSGVRSDLAVKVYGDDLETLARLGDRLQRIIGGVRGAEDIKADRVEGDPVLQILANRLALAERGVSASDVLDAIETIGGKTVGEILEGRRRFALRVRLPEHVRNDRDAIERLPLRTQSGSFVTLGDVATLQIVDEPLLINREATERRIIVQANVRGRDLGSFADEAQQAVARKLKLPRGYHLSWGGQFENLRRARTRLFVVVPLALALIATLLYLAFRNLRAAMLILFNVPMAATGGVLLLAARGLPLSISAGVGFVALFGVAVLNGLVLVNTARDMQKHGHEAHEAARLGALRRLRPVMTTALVASLGFVPMALATGSGAEVQRPLATVVIGGLVTSTLLTLLVIPTLYARIFRSPPRKISCDAP